MVAAHCKTDDPLNCWTSSSDISGYHTDFHEGHCTVGAGQGRGMAWERHGRGMLCGNRPLLFHNNIGYENAPQCYIIGTQPDSYINMNFLVPGVVTQNGVNKIFKGQSSVSQRFQYIILQHSFIQRHFFFSGIAAIWCKCHEFNRSLTHSQTKRTSKGGC